MTDTTSEQTERKLLDELYADFEDAGLIPLWTQVDGLMPMSPQPAAVPHLWRWAELLPIAQRSGELVPVGRGGERRAMALSNPGLPGLPYATADPVDRDPVPGAARGRPLAPAQPGSLPVRRRRRGRVDQRRRGRGRDAAR